MPIRTRLQDLFPRVRVPVVSAPMAGAAGGLLAARVSAAGGYGFIGAAGAESSFLSTEISIVRKELDIPTTSSERLPIGVGFQVWKLHEMDRKEAEKNLRSTAEQVSCVWLSFGHGIESWLAHIDPPCKTAVVVSSVAEAIEASSWTKRPDILVVQGFEAGGHKKADCLPFISLVPEVISALSSHRPLPIILAAGGIATGSQVASALALGADGVVCGTRFLATDEAGYSQKQKDRILQSSGEEAVSTMVFDEMRGTTGWPAGVDARGLTNLTLKDSLAGVPHEELKRLYAEGMKTGDVDRIVTWSGTSVGLVKKQMAPGDIVRELERDAEAAIWGLSNSLH